MALSQKQKTQQISTQRQELSQKFEHKQQVAVALLAERSLVELEEQVRKELDDNPALEVREEWDESYHDQEEADDASEIRDSEEIGRDADYDEGRTDFPNDDDGLDISDNRIGDYYHADRESNDALLTGSPTFYDSLEAQLIDFDLTEEEHDVMCYLIGSLDNNGYLLKELQTLSDELYIYFQKDVSTVQLEHLLKQLQTLEPHGVGARNEQECMHLQLQHKELKPELKSNALKVVEHFYELFIHQKWTTLQKRLHLNDEEFDEVLRVLKHLNLKPGAGFNEEVAGGAPTIIPDFFVSVSNEGNITIELNNGNVPELCVSASYLEMVRQLSPKKEQLPKSQMDELVLVQDKITAAKNFINTINMRTLAMRNVGKLIVQKQRAFFINDDDESLLTPMKLNDIAEALGIHVSTVSRLVRNKYLQTAYGTYPLKKFFSTSFVSQKGEEQSALLTRLKMEELIAGEDKRKPLSDEQIAAAMTELGFPLARRTVAKYREQLGIPEKRIRKIS
jgi:RNA polymerase sigma-54 factor